MALFSPKRKVSDTENKLRVLFCVNALGMVTQEQLWPFIAQLELMEYLPFCMFVDELRKGGAIAEGGYALEGALYLTDAGRQQLSLFSNRMIHADRQRILSAAPAYVDRLSQRRQVQTAYEGMQDGEYRAVCTVREEDVPTLLLRMATPDARLAEKTVKDFRERVPQLLTLLYTLPFVPLQAPITVVTQQEALTNAAPGQCAVCAFGGREHAAMACVADAETRYTMLLRFSDAGQAQGWAQAAVRDAQALTKRVTDILSSGAGRG